MTDLSFRFLLALMLGVAIVSGLAGALLGAYTFTATCTIGPRLNALGAYVGPELHCPVPVWVYTVRP